MKEENGVLISENGGRRQVLGERWDLIPGGWQSLSEVAKIAHYGNVKHAEEPDEANWQKVDPRTEQSPLNHGINHAYKALEFPPGSPERIRQLAKVAWNALAQIWFEKAAVGNESHHLGVEQVEVVDPAAEAGPIGTLKNLFKGVGGE